MLRLALADRPSIRIAKAHQPISDHPIAAKPLLGLPQQPLGLADRLLQLADQPPKPPIAWSTRPGAAGVATHHLDLTQGLAGNPSDLGGEPVHLGHRLSTTASQ